ncbi:SPOSA6832_04173 [Sporobolomyces salmonicolor]|uniref:SPOSA6832_04173-mRNA-1:cds n=1 Tax=Sporidiobolus salmonicolor TaxID=5005 RepID=A0A0D6EQX9_SPOSA|nr:SPOSA6832_04173 [Sporobolomyces salmonicolor]
MLEGGRVEPLLRRRLGETGCRILQADNLEEWIIALRVLGDETVYAGEEFALRFRFTPGYPIDSPEVTFVVSPEWKPPVHPHVYGNGHICASVLGSGWSPVLNVQSLLLTMQSMLASCQKKELPPDNDRAYHDGNTVTLNGELSSTDTV